MVNEFEKNSEDEYAGVDFKDDGTDDELKAAEFIGVEPKSVKLQENETEKMSQFYSEDDKLLAEKIIDKKTGAITEIKYTALGKKESVTIRDKDKVIRKSTDYYEGGSLKLVTDYGRDGSYKSMMYNVDGSRQSYVEKHKDGTADAVYYDADGKGAKLLVKLDRNKEVLEKKLVRD